MRKVVWLAGLLALATCNTPFNPTLLPGSLAGNWSGPLTSGGATVGTLRLSMVPGPDIDPATTGGVAGWTVTGTWSIALPSGSDSGTVAGRGTDAGIAMHFTLQSAGGCSIELSGTQVGVSSLTGPYVASSCPLADQGNYTITKQ